MIFRMLLIGFLKQATEPELKLPLKGQLKCHFMSLQKPKAVCTASKRECSAAGGEVQLLAPSAGNHE